MTDTLDIAIVGASSMAGEALLSVLESRKFPVGRLYLLDGEENAGEDVIYIKQEIIVQPIADFDFNQARLVFIADPELEAHCSEGLFGTECVVIHATGESVIDLQQPVVIPGVNHDEVDGAHLWLASPASAFIASVLKPIHDACEIERIDLVSMHAVSGAGKAAQEELGQQTASLLGFREAQTQVFPKQIAFNVIPQVGEVDTQENSVVEQRIENELRQCFGEAIEVSASAIRIPAFYGCAISLHVQVQKPVSYAELYELIETVAQIGKDDTPTPVSHSSGKDEVFVGRLRMQGNSGQQFKLWVVGDDIRLGMATNSVQLAEILVKKSFISYS